MEARTKSIESSNDNKHKNARSHETLQRIKKRCIRKVDEASSAFSTKTLNNGTHHGHHSFSRQYQQTGPFFYEMYEVRRAYVILSRDGVVTVQKISEAQNDVLEQCVEFYEIPTDVNFRKLLETLQNDNVLKMFDDIYKGWINNEKYNEEFKNVYNPPEPDDAYEAEMTLQRVFEKFYMPEPEPEPESEPEPDLNANNFNVDDIKL